MTGWQRVRDALTGRTSVSPRTERVQDLTVARAQGRLLALQLEKGVVYPGFQFNIGHPGCHLPRRPPSLLPAIEVKGLPSPSIAVWKQTGRTTKARVRRRALGSQRYRR